MKIETLAEGFLGANCYLLSSGGHAFVVDPAARLEVIEDALYTQCLTLDAILLTHGHFDHVMTLESLLRRHPVPVYIGAPDKDFLSDGRKNAFSIFFGAEKVFPPATDLLADGDILSLGTESLTVITTPGHSGGSVCFYHPADNPGEPSILLTGDTLFSDNVGRTDLYGGNTEVLYDSLRALHALSERDPSTVIYPGHGHSARLTDALSTVLPY